MREILMHADFVNYALVTLIQLLHLEEYLVQWKFKLHFIEKNS